MGKYVHRVQYYETDRMGVTHHSNYIRWMEEARVAFLSEIGWPYSRLEEEGLVSPVTAVSVKYLRSTTFSDSVEITVSVLELRGARMRVGYTMERDGVTVCTAESSHAFLSSSGRPLILEKAFPELFKSLSLFLSPSS